MAGKRKKVSPRKKAVPAVTDIPADLPALVEWLTDFCDKPRLEKVSAMLKSTRHQLFCDSSDERCVGVIRSQRTTQIVYACQIASDGVFGCCDHELEPCLGQLHNRPCKHLLVLLLGLQQAGRMSIPQIVQWLSNIKKNKRKPSNDQDLMAETLLKYRGAEAGTVDWRPLETIPEDYYSL